LYLRKVPAAITSSTGFFKNRAENSLVLRRLDFWNGPIEAIGILVPSALLPRWQQEKPVPLKPQKNANARDFMEGSDFPNGTLSLSNVKQALGQ